MEGGNGAGVAWARAKIAAAGTLADPSVVYLRGSVLRRVALASQVSIVGGHEERDLPRRG